MIDLALVTLLLSPWKGPPLPTVGGAASTFKLTVHGNSKQAVDLAASGLPNGWIASFCTPSFCSPMRYRLQLNDTGNGVIEFAVIRTDDAAPRKVHVLVESDGAEAAHADVTARP